MFTTHYDIALNNKNSLQTLYFGFTGTVMLAAILSPYTSYRQYPYHFCCVHG